MAQPTTNLGKIHVFPSETLYNQFKDIIADNDLALLKDDGAYIVAALLEQNGYVKFSNGLILQWEMTTQKEDSIVFPVAYQSILLGVQLQSVCDDTSTMHFGVTKESLTGFSINLSIPQSQFQSFKLLYWLSIGI